MRKVIAAAALALGLAAGLAAGLGSVTAGPATAAAPQAVYYHA